jgi:hypothetical protein
MLLRQAGIWDDTKNITPPKKITINDISPYWYGYGEK